ncbi:Winged helix DNA-binding domain-containing protein [Mycena venus]|uniref:Winged helix DNA-binding domain-containing protein n=1 Tax=Mycena venus TaxID=2733690 RepID=A0A8H7CG10_9AGAR|nr:Winged helix DNA-binding domain-containing protein [Mycena venus]
MLHNQSSYIPFDTFNINAPVYQIVPIQSYHSPDESDTGSDGGGGFRRSEPDFMNVNHLLLEDSLSLAACEQPQYVTLTPLMRPAEPDMQQYLGDRDEYHARTTNVEKHHLSHFQPTAMPPNALQQSSNFFDVGNYLRKKLKLPPNAPVNLWSVREPAGGGKPSIPYPMLIKLAIYGSLNKRLTLQEIYFELTNRFAWFRDHNEEAAPWKNSIRHNLSLNKVFQQIQRPVTEPGKGNYWTFDFSGGEGEQMPA